MAPAFEAPLLLPTFSRRREIFAGRLAIVGFAAVAAWEVCFWALQFDLCLLDGRALRDRQVLVASFAGMR
jgi:hypothetical protein